MDIEEYIDELSKEQSFDSKKVIKALCSFIDKEDWLVVRDLKEKVYLATYGEHFNKQEADIEVSRMHIMDTYGAFVPFVYCKNEYEKHRGNASDLNVYDFYVLVNYFYKLSHYGNDDIKYTTKKAVILAFGWIRNKESSIYKNVYNLIRHGDRSIRLVKGDWNSSGCIDSDFFGYVDINEKEV